MLSPTTERKTKGSQSVGAIVTFSENTEKHELQKQYKQWIIYKHNLINVKYPKTHSTQQSYMACPLWFFSILNRNK